MNARDAAPLWAVLGAPLVGGLLLIGLLALGSPGVGEPVTESAVSPEVEVVEMVGADPVTEPDAPLVSMSS